MTPTSTARTTATAPPQARTLQQPGPAAAVRINARQAAGARHLRFCLQPGLSLFDALVEPLAAHGINTASITLLGGWFSAMQHCVSVRGPAGGALLMHSAPIASGAAYLATANATLAQGTDGKPLVHCHAALVAADGRMQGGHLLTQQCIVAGPPAVALVTSLGGIALRAAFDPETMLPLVQPAQQ